MKIIIEINKHRKTTENKRANAHKNGIFIHLT